MDEQKLDQVMKIAMGARARLNPLDLRDAEYFMNEFTWEMLRTRAVYPADAATQVSTIFGLPVRIDDNLPNGAVELRAETALDRAVRRASERGYSLQVMSPMQFPETVAPPTPTLRALLKHWWKRMRRG